MAKRKTKCKYMHLINGEPAVYVERERQIFFARNGTSIKELLVDSLKDIRRQQHASTCWREEGNYSQDFTYSYLRVNP